MSSSTSSLPGAIPFSAQQPRPGRSNSISTSTESSLPSPPNSTADLPSPPPRMPTDSPPPTMSASLGRLDGVAMARAGLSADTDFGQHVRAKKGQKRHSISGGSALGYPHQSANPNHVVLKAPTIKKKARFDQNLTRPSSHHSHSLSDLPRPLTALSASVPVSSPISILAGGALVGGPGAVNGQATSNGLPCSKCAEMLPLRSASVPFSEDPICERCAESEGGAHHHHHNHRRHGQHHQRAFSSSSVPVRSTMSQLSMTASVPLESWDSGDEDYEVVTRPSSPLQPQPRKLPGEWTLEEEFSFLDTVDSDDETAPPAQPPTLAGWGGPFFRNMPMPPPKMPHAMSQQQQQQQPYPVHALPSHNAPSTAAAAAYPSPVSSFLGYNGNASSNHRSSTSSPSSASSHSPFPSNLPTPGETHGSSNGVHLHDYPPASPVTDSSFANLAQRRGLGTTKLNFGSPAGASHRFLPPGSGLKATTTPPINTLFGGSHPFGALPANDLEFLVQGGPPSPIVFGSSNAAGGAAMRRTHSGAGASVLGLGGTTAHHSMMHAGMDDQMGDALMSEDVDMGDLH